MWFDSECTPRRWMITAIVLLAIAIALGVGGCVIAAVGFGLSPKDMFDYPNLSMRIAGIVMAGVCALPLTVSICCWIFFVWAKRNDKQPKSLPQGGQAYVMTAYPSNQMAMAQYPYSTDTGGDNRIYKPQQPPPTFSPSSYDPDHDDSSVPLKFSSESDRHDDSMMQYGASANAYDDGQHKKGYRGNVVA